MAQLTIDEAARQAALAAEAARDAAEKAQTYADQASLIMGMTSTGTLLSKSESRPSNAT